MKNKKMFLIMASMLMCGMLALWGCPKNSEITAIPEAQKDTAASTGEAAATTRETSREPARTTEASGEARERSSKSASGLRPVYFDFDRSTIRDDARDVLKANAEWLRANPKVKIRIEGNCDERGTVEFNQVLGQQRAAGAKRYLTGLGIAVSRISLISYGKEKPVCKESTEECWQKNRKDDFVVMTE
jgi:peptidoglycan-associated lipoprotein